MFIDEVRAAMPDNTIFDTIKYNIMELAKLGCHELVIDRPTKEDDLTNEMQWLRDNGFSVKEWNTRHACCYYPSITISW